MADVDGVSAEDHLSGHPVALAVLAHVREILEGHVPFHERVTRSQVAFRRRHGFAWIWLPGQYLRSPHADCVLSLALGRRDDSPRFKEVVHPSPRHWMHHLEIRDPAQVDDEVRDWLWEAADRAG